MKRIFSMFLALAMALSLFAAMPSAAEPNNELKVRVNSSIVKFPDAQPFIDSNGRTLIPVRFVTEQLGADVQWNGATRTATISKNGVTVDITIDNAAMKVTKGGNTSTVQMDTAAVLKDGRTYVPIRFVAEALGAYVDYSGVYNTVGIFQDKLTADQIKALREFPYTAPTDSKGQKEMYPEYFDGATKLTPKISAEREAKYYDTYAKFLAEKGSDKAAKSFGTDRSSFSNFANAREHLFHIEDSRPYQNIAYGSHLRLSESGRYYDMTEHGTDADSYYAALLDETITRFRNASNKAVQFDFIADTSCMYQPDARNTLFVTIRGYVKYTIPNWESSLAFVKGTTDQQRLLISELAIANVSKSTLVPVDIHLYCAVGDMGFAAIRPLG